MMKNNMIYTPVVAIAFLFTAISGAINAHADYRVEVTGKNTKVYSGPNANNNYICSKLALMTKLTVVSKRSTPKWLAIRATKGCFSIVLQKDVKLSAGNLRKGTVISNTHVFATGDTFLNQKKLKDLDGLAPQEQLIKGDTIKKLGAINKKWYIISSPKNALFFVEADKVQRIASSSTMRVVAMGNKKTDDKKKADKKKDKTGDIKKSTDKTKTEKTDKEKDKIGLAIEKLQNNIVAESKKPFKKRNYKHLISEAIRIQIPKGNKHLHKQKQLIKYMQGQIEIARTMQEVNAIVDNAKKSPATSSHEKTTALKPIFVLEGTLKPSKLYNSAVNKYTIYQITNPKTGKTAGYVRDTVGDENLNGLVGSILGLTGDIVYDSRTGLQILNIKDVKLLKKTKTTTGVTKPDDLIAVPDDKTSAADKAAADKAAADKAAADKAAADKAAADKAAADKAAADKAATDKTGTGKPPKNLADQWQLPDKTAADKAAADKATADKAAADKATADKATTDKAAADKAAADKAAADKTAADKAAADKAAADKAAADKAAADKAAADKAAADKATTDKATTDKTAAGKPLIEVEWD